MRVSHACPAHAAASLRQLWGCLLHGMINLNLPVLEYQWYLVEDMEQWVLSGGDLTPLPDRCR